MALHSKGIFSAVICLLFSACVPVTSFAVDVEFTGELLDHPCQIATESLNQTLIFKERPIVDFRTVPGRSPVEHFAITLTDCDAHSIWKLVKVKFSGIKEAEMGAESDYFLAMGAGGNQGKLAIGLLDTDGATPLKLGEAHNSSKGTMLDSGSMVLKFGAFVQATPGAIKNNSVVAGEYNSTVNFELFYE